jgi:hypothetical protein
MDARKAIQCIQSPVFEPPVFGGAWIKRQVNTRLFKDQAAPYQFFSFPDQPGGLFQPIGAVTLPHLFDDGQLKVPKINKDAGFDHKITP